MVVLARMTAPARRRRTITVALRAGTKSRENAVRGDAPVDRLGLGEGAWIDALHGGERRPLPVIGGDAIEIELHQPAAGETPRGEGGMDRIDRRLDQMKIGLC